MVRSGNKPCFQRGCADRQVHGSKHYSAQQITVVQVKSNHTKLIPVSSVAITTTSVDGLQVVKMLKCNQSPMPRPTVRGPEVHYTVMEAWGELGCGAH